MEQQNPGHKADPLTVANLCSTKEVSAINRTCDDQQCGAAVPLYPAESRPSGGCREKAALHRAGQRSTGGWGRSVLRRRTHSSFLYHLIDTLKTKEALTGGELTPVLQSWTLTTKTYTPELLSSRSATPRHLEHLTDLGFRINWTKSCLIPECHFN